MKPFHMGGFNSGGRNKTRACVESCVNIDAAMLHSVGMFGPGKQRAYFWPYTHGDGRASCVVFAITAPKPTELWLVIWPGKSWRAVTKLAEKGGVDANAFDNKQRVAVSVTPCHYGKERHWLHCPRCERRVFRLFYYSNLTVNGERAHRFACRDCYQLTYAQRQARGYWLQQIRVGKLTAKLVKRGADTDSGGVAWRAYLPERPKGMKMARYVWLTERFDNAADELRGAFAVDVKRMAARFDAGV